MHRRVDIVPREGVERLLRGALDAMRTHIAVLDDAGTIILVNDGWTRFGLENGLRDTEGGVGTNYVRVCEDSVANGDASAGRARDAIVDLLSGRIAHATFEYPCPSPDKVAWYIFRASRFDLEGNAHIIVSHDDITSRRLAEDALRASHDALESFHLAVSHDIRAPLRRIEELSRLATESEPEDAGPLLARVQEEARRARSLANDLLDLSRVSGAPVRHAELDLSKIARESIEPLLEGARGRKAKVFVEPGMKAVGDPRLVRLILANLLANAWKFTKEKEVAVIEVGSLRDAGGRLSYFVRDNGIGFDDDDAARLFRPFTRLAAAQSYEGTGVGLAIVRRAIERHGGRVWATGTPGAGATIRFTLGGS